MKKLRMLRSFRSYRPGQVVEIPGGLAMELIETAAVEHDVETADATPKRRRKK